MAAGWLSPVESLGGDVSDEYLPREREMGMLTMPCVTVLATAATLTFAFKVELAGRRHGAFQNGWRLCVDVVSLPRLPMAAEAR